MGNTEVKGRVKPLKAGNLISVIAMTVTLFTATCLLDIMWVHHKGYGGLVPWSTFFKSSFHMYAIIAVVAYLVAPLIGRIFRPGKIRVRTFDVFAVWWVYVTLMLVLLVNEEWLSGRLTFSNPKTALITLVTLIIPLVILRKLGTRLSLNNATRYALHYIIAAILLVAAGIPVTLKYTSPKIGQGLDEWDPRYHPNVILITFDTLRADHLGIYGYERPTSYFIDSFAEKAIVYDNAFTPIPLTNPAHATIMTGNLPQNHLVLTNTSTYEGIPTIKPDGTAYENIALGTILREHGYQTFAAVSAIHLGNDFGWGHSFDNLNQYTPTFSSSRFHLFRTTYQLAPMRFIAKGFGSRINYTRKSDEVVDCFIEWANRRDRDRPFFAWLHMFDVHTPYNPPDSHLKLFETEYDGFLTCSGPDVMRYNNAKDELISEGLDLDRYIEHARASYDAELKFMDQQFGRLMGNFYDKSLIIVCSDHGEALGERGFIGHNSVLFDYETRVPLFIKPPSYDLPGTRIDTPVTLCDIAPTIYDFLDIDAGLRLDGKSVLGIDSETQEHEPWPVPGMIFLVSHTLRWQDKQIVRMVDPDSQQVTWSYYDLIEDPGAFNDLYASEGILPEKYKSALLNWIDGTGADFSILAGQAREKAVLDEWTIEQLRANGYLN